MSKRKYPKTYTCRFYKYDSDIVGDIIHYSKELGVSRKAIVCDAIREYLNQIKKIESYGK